MKEDKNEDWKKQSSAGLSLILLGYVLMAASRGCGGTDILDFLSGLMAGLSIGVTLVGLYLAVRAIRGNRK